MLVDRYGKNVEIGDWFIRLDQNNEGRLYRADDYPADGRITVREHNQCRADGYLGYGRVAYIKPVDKQRTIKKPDYVIWYPIELLPEIRT